MNARHRRSPLHQRDIEPLKFFCSKSPPAQSDPPQDPSDNEAAAARGGRDRDWNLGFEPFSEEEFLLWLRRRRQCVERAADEVRAVRLRRGLDAAATEAAREEEARAQTGVFVWSHSAAGVWGVRACFRKTHQEGEESRGAGEDESERM